MSIYEFIVSFVGQVPEQFQFIYTILTAILCIMILGVFTSLYCFILKLFRGGR